MRLIALPSSTFMGQERTSSEKLVKSNASTGALLDLFSAYLEMAVWFFTQRMQGCMYSWELRLT